MITPEEDFQNWLVKMSSSVDDFNIFSSFVPQIENLFSQLIENQTFEDKKLQGKEKAFIREFKHKVIPKIKMLGKINADEKIILLKLFNSFIKFGISCYTNLNDKHLNFLLILIPDQSWKLISNNPDENIDKMILDIFNDESVAPLLQDYLLNRSNTQKQVMVSVNGLLQLQRYYDEINIDDLSNITTEKFIKIGKDNIKNLTISSTSKNDSICDYYKYFLQRFTNQDCIFNWLDLFYIFADSDIFDRQIFGFQFINYILDNQETGTKACEWFSNNDRFGILKKKNIRAEIMPLIANICSVLSNKEILPFEIIEELWGLNYTIYATSLNYFYNMFIVIGKNIPLTNLSRLSQLIISPNEKSQVWFDFIFSFADMLGKRNDAQEAYSVIRDIFWSIAFDETNEFCNVAKDKLKYILRYYTTPELLCDYVKELLSYSSIDTFAILENVVSIVPLPDENLTSVLLNEAMKCLNTVDKKSYIYSFIINLCTKNSLLIEDEEIESLFSLQKDEKFFNFIQELVNNELCNMKKISELLQSIRPEEVNDSFIKLLQNFAIKHMPEGGVIEGSFDGEDIMWHLSCSDTSYRKTIMDLLVKTYISANNENIERIVNRFLDKWKSVFAITEKKNCLIDILREFIIEAESKIDYEEYSSVPHGIEIAPKVTVEVTGAGIPVIQKHVVHDSMPIDVLRLRIARYAYKKPGDFILQRHGKELCGSLSVGYYAINGSLQIASVPASVNIVKKKYKILPSVIISQTDIPDIMTELLKENVAEAKSLLNHFPTNTYVKAVIESLHYLESFDYSKFLPVEYPMLFMYNFESLCSLSSIDDLLRTHAIDYLIECVLVTPDNITKAIIMFINSHLTAEMKIAYAQKIFEPCFTRIFNCIEESKEVFRGICSFVTKFLSIEGVEVELPPFFNEALKKFLLFDDQEIVNSSKEIFKLLKFDQKLIIDLLPEADDNQKCTLFNAMSNHITEFNQEIQDMVIDTLADDPDCIWLNDALLCLYKMTLINISEENAATLETALINAYLCVDGPCNKSSFQNACNILAKIKTPELLAHIEDLQSNMSPVKQWNIVGDNNPKSDYGSGLINLGATCFLNSTLQQFFGIPTLRKAVLEYKGQDAFMIELKTLFARMILSDSPDQTTESLVQKWVGWDGECMNPLIQQDACEFAQNLLDKLEKAIGLDFIHELFQGKIVHHTEGITEEYHSESTESFYTLLIPVKGVSNFDESLDQLSVPEFFTGENQYNAEELGHKIDAKRYATIGETPPFLIIQLARFEYNYQTGMRTKIDSSFAFPVNLTLNSIEYKLSGVIVHIGTAEYGHYVSYVRDRQTNIWTLCNDTSVTVVTEKQVLEASYGNSAKSAYIVFYDRSDFDAHDAGEVDQDLQEIIDAENNIFKEQSILFSTPYMNLMKELKAKESLQYYCLVLPFTTFVFNAPKFVKCLINAVKEDNDMKDYLVGQIENLEILQPLLYSYDEGMRSGTVELVELVADRCETDALDAVWGQMGTVLPYLAGFNEYFHLVDIMIKESTIKHAEEKEWSNVLHSFITKTIPDYAKGKNLTLFNLYSCLNMTSLFSILTKIPLSEQFISLLTSDEFIKSAISSQTQMKAIAELLKKVEFSKEKFSKFIQDYSLYLPFERIIELIMRFYDDEGFAFISDNRFFFNNRIATFFDILSVFALLILHQNMGQFFVDHIDNWAKDLVSGDEKRELAIANCIAYIVPHRAFGNIDEFPSCSYQSDLFLFTEEEENEKMISNANIIIDFIHRNINLYIQKIADFNSNKESVKFPIIDVLIALHDITNSEVVINDIVSIIDAFRIRPKPFDKTVQKCLVKLSNANVFVPVIDDFVLLTNSSNFLVGTIFFGEIMPHIIHEGISKRAATVILQNFASPTTMQSKVTNYLVAAAEAQPEVAKEYLETHTISPKNFVNLIAILKAGKFQMPVFEKFIEAIPYINCTSLNNLVIDCFEVNNGPIPIYCYDELLKSPFITGDARKLILERSMRTEKRSDCVLWFFVRGDKEDVPTDKVMSSIIMAATDAIREGLDPNLLDGVIGLLEINECREKLSKGMLKPLFDLLLESDMKSPLLEKLKQLFA